MMGSQGERSSSKNKIVLSHHSLNSSDDEENSLIREEPPLVSSYNHRIRPLLDAVDRLRHLAVMKEGIQLPTIVVVGDQSSGKSSVLESLAGISLPRGQGICTRVPLIMRLKHHPTPQPELSLEFLSKIVSTDETQIAEAIKNATDEIAGSGKGISHTPLTLVVKKNGVPDLTMVDLPGITRVPVHGQPENIYEQISDIIMEYISPEASIILNVLSATVDFPTCESIRMSQRVDKTGERTLAVVTKADKAPEGLLEKVAADDVNIGLGYVCVRNRIGDESYEEARKEEARLFATHPLLSKIDKSIVGIPVLAKKLVQIQATSIKKSLPEIVTKINDKLNSNVSKLSKMPPILSSVAEAMTAFMRILGSSKESLRKILLRGEFDEYPDDKEMHCTARLAEKLNKYSDELQSISLENDPEEDFLMEEIRVLEEAKGIGLPNFLPRTAFLTILQRRVKGISQTPIEFVDKVWNYIEGVVISVLMHHSENYPQLQSSTRRAAFNLIAKMRERSTDRVKENVEMEKLTDYTCNPEYLSEWGKLMAKQSDMMEVIADESEPSLIKVEGFGVIEVGHLRQYMHLIHQAFDLKMRMTAYWKIVLRRLVDCMALHLLHSVRNLVNKDMEMEIVKELMGPYGGGIERMLEESPSVAQKRERLNKSIKLLKESKDVVAKIMDKIATQAETIEFDDVPEEYVAKKDPEPGSSLQKSPAEIQSKNINRLTNSFRSTCLAIQLQPDFTDAVVRKAHTLQRATTQEETDSIALGITLERGDAAHNQVEETCNVLRTEVEELSALVKSLQEERKKASDVDLVKEMKQEFAEWMAEINLSKESNGLQGSSMPSSPPSKPSDELKLMENMQLVEEFLGALGFEAEIVQHPDTKKVVMAALNEDLLRNFYSGAFTEQMFPELRDKFLADMCAKF